MLSNEVDFGQLIDCTEEEFRKHFDDKDLGYVQSLHNLMVQTFNQVQEVKDAVVEKLKNNPAEQTEENKNILNGLYSKLFRVEQRVFILRELIKSRELPPPEAPASGT